MSDLSIWKFRLGVTREQEIEIPRDAKILTVQVQRGHPVLWAVVLTSNPIVRRRIVTYGTGHEVGWEAFGDVYIATYQLPDGTVWHVFDGKLGSQ